MSTNTGQSMSTTKTLKTSSSDVSDTTTSAASSTSSPFRRCYSPKNRNRKRKNEAEQNSDDDDHNDDENGALLFQDIDDDYRIRPYSLRFCSDTVEERFIRHFYNLRNYPARGVYFIWCVLISVGFEVMTALRNQSRHVTGILLHIATISTLVSFVLLIRAGHRGQTLPGNKHEAAIAALCLPVIFAALISRHVSEGYVHSIPFIAAVATHIVGTLRFRVFGYAVPLTITLSTVIFNAREGLDVRYYLWPLCSYVAVILHYMLERQLRTEYTAIDKSEVQLVKINQKTMIMQAALVNAFPPTVARLLSASAKATTQNTDSPPSSPRSAIRNMNRLRSGHMYPNTVLVVTDAAGFTAWATRTDASVVIRVLGRMLAEFDDAAHARGVEKVGTVGDSFVGAVFGCDADDARATGRKVLRALHFAIDVVRLPHQLNFPLRNRVGVHVGDVFGGFVGLSPPVFDVFGRAVSEAKHLESSGEPSRVHVSERALRVCEECGCGRAVDVTPTPTGVLISGWEMSPSDTLSASNHSSSIRSLSPSLVSNYVNVWMHQRPKPLSLPPPATEEFVLSGSDNDDTDSVSILSRKMSSYTNSASDRGVSAPTTSAEDAVCETFKQHIITGCFCTKALEKEYVIYMHKLLGFQRRICLILAFGLIECLLLHVIFGPISNDVDQTLFIVMMIVSLAYFAALHLRMPRRAAFITTYIAYQVTSLLLICSTLDEDDRENKQVRVRDEEKGAYHFVDNVYGILILFRHLAPMFCFTVSRISRFIATVVTVVIQIVGEPYFRLLVRGDDGSLSASYGALITSCVFFVISISIENVLRSGFIARKRVELELKATSKYAIGIRAGLEVMLPSFVATQVLERDTERALRGRLGSITSPLINTPHTTPVITNDPSRRFSSVTPLDNNKPNVDDDSDDDDHDLMIWDYPMVTVAFISFHLKARRPNDEDFEQCAPTHTSSDDNVSEGPVEVDDDNTYERVAPLLDEMERTVLRHGVMKVKTTSTTMLLVAGADKAVGVSE
eukprot:PhM_4_TR18064/c1_g1_i5/m.101860